MSSSPATVVLVHGAMHGAWCWESTSYRLAAAGIAHVAVDLPGHGARASEWPVATQATYAACVTSAIDAVEGPVLLVGHSMAGQVVARAATARPERIMQLVLVNAQVLRDGETHLDTLPRTRQQQYLRLARAGGGRYRLDDDEVHRRWLQDLPRHDPRVVQALARMTPQPIAPLLDGAVGQDIDSAGVPAVYVRSLRDVGNPPERVERFVARLPQGTPVVTVPGGHDCMISRPDVVGSVLLRCARSGNRPVSQVQEITKERVR